MLKKKIRKSSGKTLLLGIRAEMAKPRETKSVREEGMNQARARIKRGNPGKIKP